MLTDVLWAIGGGALIGLSASWLLLAEGRIAGISGIVGGLLASPDPQTPWRAHFVLGLLVGGVVLAITMPERLAAPADRSLVEVAVAGVLVGFGTRLGNGCTSGHGVCGMTRGSQRSVIATLTFLSTGMLTATLLGVLR
jgi:uncharacterized membrane protein YedE/YeeE